MTGKIQVQEPLLPKHHRRLSAEESSSSGGGGRRASVTGAVFNVSTSIIGAGIMSIPATLKVLGVIPAILLILFIAVLSEVSVDFLLRFTSSGKSTTYAGLMGESFGRAGSVGLQICIMVTTLGTLIIYLIIIGDVLCGTANTVSKGVTVEHLGILQEWFGTHWWNSRTFALLFMVIFVIAPLVLLKRVESLRFSSAISILLAVVFVAISTIMAISALWAGKTKTPKLVPDLVNSSSYFELFTAVPVIVTAFTFHFNVHPIGNELNKSSDMVSAVRISLVLCATIYITVGFFGYLLFGDSVLPDILANFDQNFGSKVGSVLNDVVRLSYALHLVLVFPLLNFALRINIDGLIFPKSWPLLASHNIRFLSLTFFLLAVIYLAAIAIPNIWYFFQFMGSTTALCLAFIFPGAIVLRDAHEISTKKDRILAGVMIGLAVIASSIAIYTNINTLVKKDS
ncbi:hypothetical protein C5167_024934 [Papaver somniferum]|uniref:Amino acid transporter transmembrane domain-containing protein n=1 Tax=Papaver somniferum TaxID=3469 RepID=A0A4Y7JT23_PAPSO|nr:amino acid transporter AVT6C-like [Papaver somniferum]RZC63182.1 hypothetical protein C5167_024934 [Papaver somniferum]